MAKNYPITCCPHCGSDDGIYTLTTYVDVPYMRGFDGEAQDNSEMYDNVRTIKGGKIAYCQNCYKAICRLSTLEKQWGKEGEMV